GRGGGGRDGLRCGGALARKDLALAGRRAGSNGIVLLGRMACLVGDPGDLWDAASFGSRRTRARCEAKMDSRLRLADVRAHHSAGAVPGRSAMDAAGGPGTPAPFITLE